jgi:hypothetical protein
LLAVNYSFAKLKVNKGPVLFSGSPCDDPNAKPVVVDGGGGALSVYNCSGTQIWLHDNIYLPATQGANTISACNEGNGSYTVYCSTGYGGCTDNQYSDPVYVSSCVAQCPPHWAVTGSTRCNGNALESEEVYTSACDYSFARLAYSAVGETRWVVTDPCGCSDHQPDFRGTNQTRCSGEVLEKEMQDMSACSPTSGQTIWHIISTCGCSNFQPLWEATGAIRCDASTNYQEQREERDTKGCSPTIGQLRWIGTDKPVNPRLIGRIPEIPAVMVQLTISRKGKNAMLRKAQRRSIRPAGFKPGRVVRLAPTGRIPEIRAVTLRPIINKSVRNVTLLRVH